MQAASLTPGALARKSASTEMTISNWLNDAVQADHVKAAQLFRIADAVGADPRELLQGAPARYGVAEAQRSYASHPVKPDVLRIALQLVAETLAEGNLELPPSKQAEATQLAYDLIEEGLPQAKVLRFVLAAVA